jgi:hypothetical protein
VDFASYLPLPYIDITRLHYLLHYYYVGVIIIIRGVCELAGLVCGLVGKKLKACVHEATWQFMAVALWLGSLGPGAGDWEGISVLLAPFN